MGSCVPVFLISEHTLNTEHWDVDNVDGETGPGSTDVNTRL